MRILMLFLSLLLGAAAQAEARVNVVATLPWIGSLAQEIGGERVSVTVLVKPNQDPHLIEAKPGMVLAARRAHIVMYNGLDLETGYLALILESSKNPDVMPGRPGNFDASQFVRVRERTAAVDRSMGDVHPLGNPHYHFSPGNVLRVAEGIAAALADLDRDGVEAYRARFEAFAARLRERQKYWNALPLAGKRFVAHHRLFEYLAADFGFQIVGYIEQRPGIPPSAAHIRRLIGDMKQSAPDGILTTVFYGRKEAEALSARTGVRVIVLPGDVGAGDGLDDWFSFMDAVLEALK